MLLLIALMNVEPSGSIYAIQQGRLKFDMPQKMKVDDNPFLGDQNMVDARLIKGKTKVLTSAKSRKARIVDP